ncbi:MAG: sulfatase [Verrucomicrobiota bacterium]
MQVTHHLLEKAIIYITLLRRGVLARISQGLLVFLLGLSSLALAEDQPPNIIFFLTDDQRDDVLGCYGNELAKTPTIDDLASEGIRFENSFCQVPICAANRATILSGLSQRTHGHNFGKPPVPSEYIASSYPKVLKEAGYRIGFAGKYGMKFADPGLQQEFDFFKKIDRNPYIKKLKDGTRRHETDLCADATIEFIQSNPEGKPFCMSVSFNATHAEDGDKRPGYHFQWPESADGLFDDITMPEPYQADEKFYQALPSFLQNPKELNRQRFFWRWDTPKKYQTNMRAYFRLANGIDQAIARVIEALQAKGLSENTIIIYTGDNGLMMGDRGLAGKWNPYEQSLRVPLIIYDPRLPEALRGQVLPHLANSVDLAPTMVDYAGVNLPEVYQGRSLLPMIRGQRIAWREDIFCQHHFKRFNDWHAVRDQRYKYAVYYDQPYEALFDLQEDPGELINLADNPHYADILKQKKERLQDYLSRFPKAPEKKPKNKK